MPRPNTKRDLLEKLTNWLSPADIERAIADYLTVGDRHAWMEDLRSGRSKRYLLIRQGEPLDAAVIVKAALRSNDRQYEEVLTDPLIDLLEHFDFPVWDTEREGSYDRADGLRYESIRRLARTGQGRFRHEALNLWDGRCAVSGTTDQQVLEAAHLSPRTGDEAMSPANSIVLRIDLHRLFDTGLMAIHPRSMRVQFGNGVEGYGDLAEARVELPADGPSEEDFEDTWKAFTGR